jgi:glycosyltransferase involved in cell wall biosynthesis
MPRGGTDTDPYANIKPILKLDDLWPFDPLTPIELSVMMSTYHRRSQLMRSLECLARQDWNEFEVLIYSDGDEESLQPLCDIFKPYLRIALFEGKRQAGISPSRGLKRLTQIAQGEILAAMQPELMLAPDACRLLHHLHFADFMMEDDIFIPWKIDSLPIVGDEFKWVNFKPFFFSDELTLAVDTVDWHENWNAPQWLRNFETDAWGLSNRPNLYWREQAQFPWWFIGSARRESGIFDAIPVMKGHAAIDWYFIDYRRERDMVEVMPTEARVYHQDHQRFSWLDVSGDDEAIQKATRII